jgi:hypothetical protein
MDFTQLLKLASLSDIDAAARFLGVTKPTIYRYIKYGAPLVVRRALEFPAGTNPDYYGLKFRRDGIWCESRRVLERSELTELDWKIQQAFIAGEVAAMRRSSDKTGG